MATENRMPDDLQEAVAATLRRLRGEVRNQPPAEAPATQRSEPLFSSPRPTLPPVSALESLAAPDLLAGAGPEIPPTPAARAAMREGTVAYQEERTRGRGRWLPYALSLTAIVVFAAVVWWAYRAVVGAPPAGEVPVIAADQTPAKVPPTDQGVAEGTSQEKTVYEQISGATGQPKAEVLLPQPETPQAPPAPAPAPTPSEASTANSPTEILAVLPPAGPAMTTPGPATTTAEPAPPVATTPVTAAQQTADMTAPGASGQAGAGSASPEPTTSAPPQPATTPESGAPASQSDIDLTGVPTLAPRLAQPAPSETAPAVTTADNSGAAAAATQTAAASDNFRIQLAALKSEAEAQKSWDRILAKHTDVLSSLTLHIVRADLGAQGIYYRVQAGPFADKVSAKAVCDQLKSAGQPCLVKP